MKKKIVIIILGIILMIVLSIIPSNSTDNLEFSSDQDYAYSPPVKLPKLPPKE